MIQQVRKRIEPKDIVYSLHLYFNGLPLRNTSKAISRFVKRSQYCNKRLDIRYKPAERLSYTKIKISEFIIDETRLKLGSSNTSGFE